jgi:IS1 family transposase
MNKLPLEKRAQIIGCLVEGMSIRATSRLTGASKNTITKLLCDVGAACSAYQHATLRGICCAQLQLDEIWAFVGAKKANANPDKQAAGEQGDCWTWTAIDADTKLMVTWFCGARDGISAREFLQDLRERVDGECQITSDGLHVYKFAVSMAFGTDVDFAQLHKIFGPALDTGAQRRYSPGVCVGMKKQAVWGNPDMEKASTSFVERQNLTMRMSMRRFTRLTNAFSKKVENHEHAVALHFMHYNFAREHMTLKTTPAVYAGVTDKVWNITDIVQMADAYEAQKSN